MTNHLSDSSSPYLLQHAGQPVHWHMWGDLPFEEARERDCPVLLSIGYATCHWCHVMARESFEDEEVARFLNRHFVSIKVDREEYPELDRAAMQVCQMIHGHGGWPLNLILTPDKHPFFAATYLPKTGRLGQPGWMDTLRSLHRHWEQDRQRVLRTASTIESGYQSLLEPESTGIPDKDRLDAAVDQWRSTFDSIYGGFGDPPKFPMGHSLLFLLGADTHRNGGGRKEALFTIGQVIRGGITDALDGGIHRYSTDREWRVPHFEKMLYDQALWLLTVSEAFRQHPAPLFLQALTRTVGYLESRLQGPGGSFYCGEDADSEGAEGTFYLWRTDELKQHFSQEERNEIQKTFHLRPEGNVTLDGAREPDGRNVLYRTPLVPLGSRDLPLDPPFPHLPWEQRLLELRNRRPRPERDEKILTDWNALMVAGLARSGTVTGQTAWTERAVATATFLRNKLCLQGRWYHRYYKGVVGIDATSNDYAALVWGWLELYRATFDPIWLEESMKWARDWVSGFMNEESGLLYLCRDGKDPLFERQQPIEDGALPSCNSIAAHQFLRLGMLTGQTEWLDRADRILSRVSGAMQKWPGGHLHSLHAASLSRNRHPIVVLTGQKSSDSMNRMLEVLYRTPGPERWIANCSSTHRDRLIRLAPWMDTLPETEETTAWVCYQTHCEERITDPAHLEQVLRQAE